MIINVLGVPIFYGCDREGVNLGPDTLREHGLLDILKENNKIFDLGNIYVPKVSHENKFAEHKNMKYLAAIVETNKNLAHAVYASLASKSFPFVVGGDHSLGLGSLSGAAKYFNDDLGVVWVDAHGDINTHLTTPSGNVHGMPLSAAMGIGHNLLTDLYFSGRKIDPSKVFIVGARDLDKGEMELIRNLKINVWTTNDIKSIGIKAFLEDFKNRLTQLNINNLHLSFDIDSLDSSFVPGTGTPVSKGINMKESKEILSGLFATNIIRSMDFVEFNPLLDEEHETLRNCKELLAHIAKLIK
ncbi:arginase [Clostridium sp. 'White wine YQ']|uniref:arginase n=1 Tax=Clostridium sp. 'White wine YQ' TaxID=3027474 RepID=UPI002366DCB1|nr:arginase [Clostridium sp. 'White wine YQ']MDD7793235.1 arginase [Clostridium sp. 'White wine YQ']